MTWAELRADKRLADLPCKVELNRQGRVILTPHPQETRRLPSEIAHQLRRLVPHGRVLTECAVDTPEGTIGADATWASLSGSR